MSVLSTMRTGAGVPCFRNHIAAPVAGHGLLGNRFVPIQIPRGLNPQPFGSDGTRNARSVWTFPTQPSKFRHHATFPEELARRCILAGSHTGEIVLDPFFGSGTVGVVAERLGRRWIGCELNEGYVEIARKRIAEARRTPGRGGVT